jgi:hypothetical protein
MQAIFDQALWRKFVVRMNRRQIGVFHICRGDTKVYATRNVENERVHCLFLHGTCQGSQHHLLLFVSDERVQSIAERSRTWSNNSLITSKHLISMPWYWESKRIHAAGVRVEIEQLLFVSTCTLLANLTLCRSQLNSGDILPTGPRSTLSSWNVWVLYNIVRPWLPVYESKNSEDSRTRKQFVVTSKSCWLFYKKSLTKLEVSQHAWACRFRELTAGWMAAGRDGRMAVGHFILIWLAMSTNGRSKLF